LCVCVFFASPVSCVLWEGDSISDPNHAYMEQSVGSHLGTFQKAPALAGCITLIR
jgi:hypothetical protein